MRKFHFSSSSSSDSYFCASLVCNEIYATMKTKKIISPQIVLLLLFFCLSSKSRLSMGADTISAYQTLSGDQTIISKDGNFELGFFTPGSFSNYYVGIWYKKVSEKTVVWVANRETPVKDRYASKLTIQDRNLVLLDESQNPVWSTNVTTYSSSSPLIAVLEDDGNFILTQGSSSNSLNLSDSSSRTPLWQSFDNPTHAFLPGGKLSYCKVTGKSQILTSWKNSENPAPGLFSLELDPSAKQYLIRRNRSQPYWNSGPWNGKTFSSVPEMRLNYIYNFTYVENENESYFTYNLYNPEIMSRFIIDVSGQIQQLSWLESTNEWNMFWAQPREKCEINESCGAFSICDETLLHSCNCLNGFKQKFEDIWNLGDYSFGCERKINLQCGSNSSGKREKDKFWEYNHMRLPKNPVSVAVGSAEECMSTCLNNCSCTAYSFDNNECSNWYGELSSVRHLPADDVPGRTVYIRLSASEFSSGKSTSGKNTKGIVIGAFVGSVVLVLLLLGLVLFVIWRCKMVGSEKAVGGSLLVFSYKDLRNATKNFSEKLGGGGFGSVFRGTLPDSTVIAVKKLESISQGEKQFRTEISTIGTIQHVNLVRLRGFCSEDNNKLLVYEYFENKSLDSHLFHNNECNALDFKTRYQIALRTARGLAYLHEQCMEVIIHCDIKPENILLDAEFCPKVADFGLAKLMGRNFSRILTTIRGTRGYLAPEWISGVAITSKADVYSYGMMIFEFISGRRNSENSVDGVVKFFPTWAVTVLIEEGDILSLLDPKLDRMADAEEVSRLCKVACWCVQDDENHRPSMGQVVQILEGVLDVNLPPVPRNLEVFVDSQEHVVFFTESSSCQSSEMQSKTSSSSANSKSAISSKDSNSNEGS